MDRTKVFDISIYLTTIIKWLHTVINLLSPLKYFRQHSVQFNLECSE